ncbi:MAG: efflux RND transporter periplasmic adaptor subunit [candidate division Zixibacteria bacterium]|nr:efflux RND transporter periplasmic adaptor subunit [candidate division Zixibacteria bacterium]
MIPRILITGLLIITLAGCGGKEASTDSAQTARVAVRTAPVQQGDFPRTVTVGGTLRGDRQTIIPAKVQTTVTKVPVRRGQTVRQGDLLIQLDPGGVQSQYTQAEAVFRNAEKQAKKMRALYEAGAVSETQLDGAETEFAVAQANFNAARQTIEIDAPFNGVVTDVYVRVGDEVSTGMSLVDVADISALRLILEVPNEDAVQLGKGETVSIISPVDSAQVMVGEVIGVADAADVQTRSFEVECRFTDVKPGFSPGMYVTANIETETLRGAILVPNDAIIYRSGQALVYTVAADTAALVPVTVVAAGDSMSAVSGSLQAGQKAVVLGQKNLTPGAKVREAVL